jgi:hypothetical protein
MRHELDHGSEYLVSLVDDAAVTGPPHPVSVPVGLMAVHVVPDAALVRLGHLHPVILIAFGSAPN